MKILITGGTGFIGLHTARALLDDGHEVVATQYRVRRDPPFIRAELGNRLQREVLDVADASALNALLAKHNVDGIVHLAVPGVGALAPGEEYRANMLGLLNILEAAQAHGVGRLTIASSIVAYFGLGGPWLETMAVPVASTSPTSAFKKAEEILGLHYADRTGLNLVCARIAYIYGPLYHSMVNLPSRVAHATAHGTPVKGADEALADDSFDYCYVKDCADALRLLATTPKLSQRIYNVGSGRATSNRELGAAAGQANPPGSIVFPAGGGSAGRSRNEYLDLSRITADTGYRPKWDVAKAIPDYVAWLADQEF
jgi:UDP-glucose 4-epimerase